MLTIYIGITLFALVVISLMVSGIVESFLVTQRTQTQTRETERLALEVVPSLLLGDAEALYGFVSEYARALGGRVLVLDTNAVVQVDSASQKNGYRLPYREVRDVLMAGNASAYGFHRIAHKPGQESLLNRDADVWAVYYTAPVTSDGNYIGVVLFSALIQDVEDSVTDIINSITAIFLVVAVSMSIATFMLSNWLARPITELTSAIRKMGQRGYGVRVQTSGSGEMAELGVAFNRMSEHIEDHNRIRDEFVANASHELKTPLSTMKLLSESILYQENPDPALMREFFADVSSEVDRLSSIVTELLTLVQNDVADTQLELSPHRLDILVCEAVDRLRPIAEHKGIALALSVAPAVCMMEWTRMDRAAINLIENAIKYTDAGSVFVEVRVDAEKAYLVVQDTGIGIPQESQAHLFERFYRVDRARARGTGGTGLGLAIVEEIILQHGGEIDVQSEVGQGSTFTVSLPLADLPDEK